MKEIIPADRLNTVQEYYFSTKLREVAEMNAAGKSVISLGIGSPDLPPSEETIEALGESAVKSDAHGYQPHMGIPQLRDAFAAWYKRWYGVTIDPAKEIQPLIGSKEGILHISLAFLNPGDGVLVPNPGYPTYTSVSKMAGAKIHTYDLDENNNWQPDFEALEKMDLSGVKLMWVNYPNMPTGANGSLGLFEKLVVFGREHGIVIAHDNPYSLILNENPLSIMQVEGAKEICIELNSMSKSHNMPGWRIGLVVSNPQFIGWILKVLSNIESGILKPMQMATIAALNNSDEWHRKNNIELYANRRKYAAAIMDELDCTYDENQVGMFLWGKIPAKYKSSEELADKILYDAGVFLTPGFIFGSKGERYIRISLCCNEYMLKEALERIKKLQS
ncbi:MULTISPECIES: aminotransferase class I/II-fold pyridoxal phosphate-dependent enzyme [unclassified Dysgonomonas]|jgi:aspartate/methionine/tyrosine aminotransferase|uniref:pyridoxal phosphate-dependent aminotransferase n=1 Tax=unclassified Dysgonomonas TaxID=2630389 RepID=UPI0025BE5E89|nr:MULTISPECIES: aminotransferase class I/II-fold pyridoxal phosphate-dependent enzyme [unclassified Dysgonomonas]MDR2001764.1 aminotransferase class I/II-fold pyridoxal phosphate-dependent enzyme [Prevotella sp.]HMM02675.1 aminotransferase class I/II-fold pyridoxal phosphate-dependent enzyme [Dysgonomonas sp.]